MKHKILLVDDDENILQSLVRVLRKHYSVETAVNGYDGLSILLSDPTFAVVIADMKMPGMDGIEFLQQVREKSPDTVRIMLSGNRDFESSIRAVNEGNIFRFLTKPFPAKAMLNVLETAVEQYEMNRLMSEGARLREQSEDTMSICSYCNKVRQPDHRPNDRASWERIELFLARHFGFRFSHCVCPECVDRLYAELEEQRRKAREPLIIGNVDK